jgi:DNA-binding NarL/FixJ family response regulator
LEVKFMLGRYQRGYEERPAKDQDESWRYRLTPREKEVLELLHLGLSSREIGARLGIRRETVDAHVGHIVGKLGVRNRVEALATAIERGLLEPRDAGLVAAEPAASMR